MMWLKLTCVYLTNALGYDLLFQDADLYWWKAPWARRRRAEFGETKPVWADSCRGGLRASPSSQRRRSEHGRA